MARLDTFRSNAAEAPHMRRWLLLGLVLSLGLHGVLFLYFYSHPVEGFSMGSERLAAPRAFNMKRVSIPDMPAEDQHLKIPEKLPNAKLTLPDERPEVSEVHVAPQISDLSQQVLTEKPRVDMASLNNLAETAANSRNQMDRDLNNIAQSLIKEGPHSPHQPLLAVGTGRAGGGPGEGDSNVNIPGLASVDDLLSQSGTLKAGAKAAMPGGALFEYDKYDLLPASVSALSKLGQLIQNNPKATFSIEGHTDSFGPPDYNLKLSEKRAESVKIWLVQTMGISPDRIQTHGYGNERPIVPADKSKEEQSPNRRVEIVVKTNRR